MLAGSLAASLLICEIVARLLLPARQLVRIETVEKPDWGRFPKQVTADEKTIEDSFAKFSKKSCL